jgi:polyhydroxyalkanoate synthesis regulator protein
MEMFERAFAMFAPFARREGAGGEAVSEAEKGAGKSGDIDDLKRQLDEMKRKVDRLTDKGPARE